VRVTSAGATLVTTAPLMSSVFTWQEFGWGERDAPGPQTESSIERGFRMAGPLDDDWGRSDGLDPDNVGDIADEGMGHRG